MIPPFPRKRPGWRRAMVAFGALMALAGCGPKEHPMTETRKSEVRESNRWRAADRFERMAAIAPGAQKRTMPETLYPPEAVARLKQQAQETEDAKKALKQSLDEAERYARIPDQEYRAMILPYSGYPAFGFEVCCPFCGRTCGASDAATLNQYDFAKPWQTARRCCGTIAYERERDYPAGYAYQPNGEFQILHLDGQAYAYPYWKGKDRNGDDVLFCPRSLVWQDRMQYLRTKVCPALATAYLHTGDERFARKTLVILHRFAEVYKPWPLWMKLGADRKAWLSLAEPKEPGLTRPGLTASPKDPTRQLMREEYEAWPRPSRYRSPPWTPPENPVLAPTRFAGEVGPYWGGLDGFPAAYLMVKDSRSMREYSQALYQDPAKLDGFIQSELLQEMVKECTAYPPLMGNYISATMAGIYPMGVAAHSEYLYNLAMDFADLVLLNHIYPDVAFEEGSLWYMGMMSGFHSVVKNMLGPRIAERDTEFPFSKFARENMNQPFLNMSTFRLVQSKHGDGDDSPFPMGWSQPICQKVGFDTNNVIRPVSRFMPSYGFATLSAGAPKWRTESMLLFNRGIGHSHYSSLCLQLAFEGMLVAPDPGYCAWWRTLDLTPKNPAYPKLMALPYKFKLLDAGRDTTPGDPWSRQHNGIWNLAHCGVMQNQVLIDERATAGTASGARGNARALALVGPRTPGSVGTAFQAAEAEDPESLCQAGVNCALYRRTVINVERPDGRAYVVDFFRATGGQRHIYFLKIPGGEILSNTLEKPQAVGNGQEYLNTKPGVKLGQSPGRVWLADQPDGGFQFLNDVQVYRRPPASYRMTWRRDARVFAPKSPESLKNNPVLESWVKNVPSLVLDMRGVRMPFAPDSAGQEQAEEEVWIANANYPGRLEETIEGTPQTGNMVFENAQKVYGVFRSGRTSLESRYTHVFEMYPEGQKAVIRQTEALFEPCAGPRLMNYLAGVALQFEDDSRDFVVSAPDSEWRELKAIPKLVPWKEARLAAHSGILRADAKGKFRMGALVGGKGFAADTVRVESEGDLAGEVVDIIGDITGTRRETAFIIRPFAPWPVGQALVGERIHINVAENAEDLYTIAAVQPAGPGRVRVDLEGTPPLGYHWDQVREVAPCNASAFDISTDCLFKGDSNQYFLNKRVLFPTLGLELRVARLVSAGTGWKTRIAVKPEVDLNELGVKPGTPFVIYGAAVGALARIPAHIAVARNEEGKFRVQANVDFTLSDGGKTKRLRAEELAGGELEVALKE